jgi:hypothetical protein
MLRLAALPSSYCTGDSISAGYGNECRSEHEQYSPRTTNAFMTFGAITGRAFDAEVRIVAWSGVSLSNISMSYKGLSL